MPVKTRRVFVRLSLADEEQGYLARILNLTLLALLAAAGLGCLLSWLDGRLATAYGLGAGVIALLVALDLTRRGYVRGASILLLAVLLGVPAFLLYAGLIIRDIALLLYPVIIIVGSLLLRRRTYTVLVLIIVLLASSIASSELAARTHLPFGDPASVGTVIVIVLLLWLVAISVRMLSENLMHSLARARRELAERARANEALRASEAKFQAAFHYSPIAMLISHMPDGRYMDVNDAFCGMVERSRADLLGRTARELSLWVDPAEHTHVHELLDTQGGYREQEVHFRRRSGQTGVALMSAEIVHVDGQPCLLTTLNDITARRRAEEALHESQERMRLALRSAKAGVWEWNRFTNQAVWSEENYQVMGLTPGSVESSYANWLSCVHPDDRQSAEAEVAQAIEDRSSLNAVFRVVWPDGSIHWLNDVGRMVFDEHREPIGMYGIQMDITELKQAEEALRESERRFREMLEGIELLGVTLDAAGRVTFANDYLARLTGWPRADIIGMDWFERFVPANSRDEVRAMFRQLFDSGNIPGQYENDIVTRGGERRLVRWNNTVLRDPGGRIVGTASIGDDVTERRRAEQALRENEERFRALAETTAALIVLYDAQRIYYANPAAQTASGFSEAELLQRSFMDIVHPESRAALLDRVAKRMRGEPTSEEIEIRIVTRDGRERWLALRGSQTTYHGQTLGLGTAFDITERKEAEQALRASQLRYRAIVEGTTDLICRFLPDTTLTFVNEAYCRYFGRTCDELLGLPFVMLIPEEARPGVLEQVARLVRERQAYTYQHEVIKPDGEIRWQQWTDRPILNEDGSVIELQSIGRDITEQWRAQQERERLIADLEMKNAELERFTYSVSHDLKSPLVTIRGFLGFIEGSVEKGDRARFKADLQRIRDAADKMQRLLNELLELSRIGRLIKPPESVPFEEVAREATSLVAGRLAGERAVVEIAPGLPNVYGDRARLVEVVQNLLDNAIKFMGDQPEPRIEIGQRGQDAAGMPVFFVRDNGIGIEPQFRDTVFGLFNKLDPASEGTGVGLALVKRIVEVHGGKIWLESEGAGKGSTLNFTLPTRAAAGEAKASIRYVVTAIRTDAHNVTVTAETLIRIRETTTRPTSKPKANPQPTMLPAVF